MVRGRIVILAALVMTVRAFADDAATEYAAGGMVVDLGFRGIISEATASTPSTGLAAFGRKKVTLAIPPMQPVDETDVGFAMRTDTGWRHGQWLLTASFDYNPMKIVAWSFEGAFAPRLGRFLPEVGLAAGVGMLFRPAEEDVSGLAYVSGVVGARFVIGHWMTLGVSVERTLASTQSMWMVGLSLGVDLPLLSKKPHVAPPAPPVAPAAPPPEASASIVWASSVLDFSSQYGSSSWSAKRALGPPDVYPRGGDLQNAWASASADGGREHLTLGFDAPRRIRAVEVYETYNPGAVDRITLLGATGESHVVYEGPAAVILVPAFRRRIEFPCTDDAITGVRVELDSSAVPGWNEIDAVGVEACPP
jgi:hypothetical protein